MNGYINLLKPPGMSSAAAVAFVKRLTGCKCGHAGTLDPEVAGVLPILVGRATRLQQYFTDTGKAYIGEISFSGATDTQDAQGTVTEPGRGTPAREQLERVIRERFTGEILQTPPMYSAVKREGKPLYALARAGKNVAVSARPTQITRCEVLSQTFADSFRLRIECGSGTYIRTLFHDIGQALDMPAHMRMLIRIRSNGFLLWDSVTPEQLAEGESLSGFLVPMDAMLGAYPRVILKDGDVKAARNGVHWDEACYPAGQIVALYHHDAFYGLARADDNGLKAVFLAEV